MAKYTPESFTLRCNSLVEAGTSIRKQYPSVAIAAVELYHEHGRNVAYIEKALQVAAAISGINYATCAKWFQAQVAHKIKDKLPKGYSVAGNEKFCGKATDELRKAARGWEAFQKRHPNVLDYKLEAVEKAMTAKQYLAKLNSMKAQAAKLMQVDGAPEALRAALGMVQETLTQALVDEDGKRASYEFTLEG